RSLVGRQGRVVLAAESAHSRDQVKRLDRVGEPIKLFVELEGLLRELERFHVCVYRGRALRGLPGILGGLVRHLAEQVVMRKCGEEILHAVAEDRLVRGRDAAMELDPRSEERRVGKE